MKTPFTRITAKSIAMTTTLGAFATGSERSDAPNFIIIFIDDLGYANIQPFGERYETPNLARIAPGK